MKWQGSEKNSPSGGTV